MTQEYIRPAIAAVRYPVSEGHLAQMRYMGTGRRYYKPSKQVVLYRPQDIEAWIESTVQMTSQEAS